MIKVGKVGSNPLLIHGFFEHGRREMMTIFWSFWLARLPLCCATSAWCQFISAGRLNISPPIGRAPGERVTILWIFENGAGVSSCLESSPKRLCVYNEKGQLKVLRLTTGIQERVGGEIEVGFKNM